MIQTIHFDYAIGDEVIIKPINLTGTIDGLCTDNQGRMYRVVYWNDGNRCNPWLYPWEIEGWKSYTLGFRGDPTKKEPERGQTTQTDTPPDALPQTPQKFGYGPAVPKEKT